MFEDMDLNVWQELNLDCKTNPYRDGSYREPQTPLYVQKYLKIAAPIQMKIIWAMSKAGRKDTPLKIIMEATGAVTQYTLLDDWYKLIGVIPRNRKNYNRRKYSDHIINRVKELLKSGMTCVSIGILVNIRAETISYLARDRPPLPRNDFEMKEAIKIYGKPFTRLNTTQRRLIRNMVRDNEG